MVIIFGLFILSLIFKYAYSRRTKKAMKDDSSGGYGENVKKDNTLPMANSQAASVPNQNDAVADQSSYNTVKRKLSSHVDTQNDDLSDGSKVALKEKLLTSDVKLDNFYSQD